MNDKETKNFMMERLPYADLLRAAAGFFVVLIHASANAWSEAAAASNTFIAMTVYNGLSRFCVPVFVMLSGMFMLDAEKDVTIGLVFRKYIKRIVLAFVVWSAAYTLIMNFGNLSGMTPVELIRLFVRGHYHLWFLYMIAGLYLIAPFLRNMAQSEKLTRYFLLLWLVFNCLVPTLGRLFPSETAELLLDKLMLRFVLGYSGYFVAGCYLSRIELKSKVKVIIYCLGAAGAVSTVALTLLAARAAGGQTETFLSYFSPNVAFFSFAVFLFFREHGAGIKSSKLINAASKIASCTFGVYLIHAFFLPSALKLFESLSPALRVPLAAAATYGVSLAIIFLLRKIPAFRHIS